MIVYKKIDEIENNYTDSDIVARTIYDENAKILLRKGNSISRNAVRVLKEKGYRGIYVENFDKTGYQSFSEPLIDDVKVIQITSLLKAMYENKSIVEDAYDKFYVLHLKALPNEVEELVDTLMEAYNKKELLFEILDGRNEKNFLYYHSLNVCLLSIGICIILGNLSKKEICEIGTAGLLHDMAKGFYDPELTIKRNITEEEKEILKKHSKDMYELLKTHNFPLLTLLGVWHHHLPEQIPEDKISIAGKIVAVANAYDNLVNPSPYRDKPMDEQEAIEYLSGLGKFDTEILRALFEIVVPYPVGSRVLLSNKRTGLVIKNTMGLPLRPVVLIDNNVIELQNDEKFRSVTVLGRIKKGC